MTNLLYNKTEKLSIIQIMYQKPNPRGKNNTADSVFTLRHLISEHFFCIMICNKKERR